MSKSILTPVRVVAMMAVLGTLTSAAVKERSTSGWFTQTGLPGCGGSEFIPGNCVPFSTGVLCTSTVGTATRTWFKDNLCTSPFYRLQ
ncbi:hypothetical protein [Olivibacter domesticus]|uniref:Secreted protein n=1 Tax=Olivibacter domesticus TaxID=407022 RepID=A0A1H7IFC0_OLID1|nr:hypothetical protein [Olivibacter domesticus]SEK61159.1 hypothetical protein SAMN05661044_00683 [Olivibacter domesticus]